MDQIVLPLLAVLMLLYLGYICIAWLGDPKGRAFSRPDADDPQEEDDLEI